MSSPPVLCVGEVLWDSLPQGLFIGGAPFNVACHLHGLGVPVQMASRVGMDRLGEEALRRIRGHGLDLALIQEDPDLPTGFVSVTVDRGGNADYEIVAPAAWDAIELTGPLWERAASAQAIVFGSLAQRAEVTRCTIARLCEIDALKVFDVNLRPPHDDPEIVRQSLWRADVAKLNEHELRRLGGWLGIAGGLREQARAVAERFSIDLVCVTRGANGAALWHRESWSEHPGFPVEVTDTVGSGDAFLAALLAGLLNGEPDDRMLERANLMGAYVATRFGAVPDYRTEDIERLRSGSRSHR